MKSQAMYSFQNNLRSSDNPALKQKLRNLDTAYFAACDTENRQNIILAIDEVIVEMMKRGIYDKSIQRSK